MRLSIQIFATIAFMLVRSSCQYSPLRLGKRVDGRQLMMRKPPSKDEKKNKIVHELERLTVGINNFKTVQKMKGAPHIGNKVEPTML